MPDPIVGVIIYGAFQLSRDTCKRIDVGNIAADKVKAEADAYFRKGSDAYSKLGSAQANDSNMKMFVEAIGNLLTAIPLLERVPPRRQLFLFIFNIEDESPVNEALADKCKAHKYLAEIYRRLGGEDGEKLAQEHEEKYQELDHKLNPPRQSYTYEGYRGFGV